MEQLLLQTECLNLAKLLKKEDPNLKLNQKIPKTRKISLYNLKLKISHYWKIGFIIPKEFFWIVEQGILNQKYLKGIHENQLIFWKKFWKLTLTFLDWSQLLKMKVLMDWKQLGQWNYVDPNTDKQQLVN